MSHYAGVDSIQPPANVTISIKDDKFIDYSWTYPSKEMVDESNITFPHCSNLRINGSVSAISICGRESIQETFQGMYYIRSWSL